MSTSALTPSIFDTGALANLKRQAGANDPAALKAAAQQFEALFLQMVLKSMRDATPREGLFDSDQTRLYESLLDQQLGQAMTAKGGMGLAALIEKQLRRASEPPVEFPDGLPLPAATRPPLTAAPAAMPVAPAPLAPAAATAGVPSSAPATTGGSAEDFVAAVWPHAQAASRATGVPAAFLVAQAALETGWGRSEPRTAAGQPSFNLFGIKAGRGWTGPAVDSTTTEYVDGVAQRRVERFRAYGSYADSFEDYARLLRGSPRYAAALGATDPVAFGRALQQGGYATDPAYADKLERIINGQTLRTALLA